jgi:ABC-type sugar transport system permease subunit
MRCPHCGANLSLEDMTRPNCPYCQNVLAHHARAAEHAALVNRMLDDRIRAQYPGTPPGAVPQIGYQYGAQLQGLEQFQNHHIHQGFQRARWLTLVMVIVPIVMVFVIGGVAAFVLLLAR